MRERFSSIESIGTCCSTGVVEGHQSATQRMSIHIQYAFSYTNWVSYALTIAVSLASRERVAEVIAT